MQARPILFITHVRYRKNNQGVRPKVGHPDLFIILPIVTTSPSKIEDYPYHVYIRSEQTHAKVR